MDLTPDKDSRTPSMFVKRPFFSHDYSAQSLNLIESLTASELGKGETIKRICLHKFDSADIHVMLIMEKNGHEKLAKKHVDRAKFFFLIRGQMRIELFDDNRTIINSEDLVSGTEGNFMYIDENTYHRNFSITDEIVYIEVIKGPFHRDSSHTQYMRREKLL